MGCGIKDAYEEEQENEKKRQIKLLKVHSYDDLLSSLQDVERNLKELVKDRSLSMTRGQMASLDYAYSTVKDILNGK